MLEAAIRANPQDAHAPYLLGNLLYDRHRHEEAIRCWQRSVKIDATLSIAWRNLGIGYFNVLRNPKGPRGLRQSFPRDPTCARVLYEHNQLGNDWPLRRRSGCGSCSNTRSLSPNAMIWASNTRPC